MEHKCQELVKVNQDNESNCAFTIIYDKQYANSNINNASRCMWVLRNNNDDYYAPAYINFCPFCGEDLNKIKPNEIF